MAQTLAANIDDCLRVGSALVVYQGPLRYVVPVVTASSPVWALAFYIWLYTIVMPDEVDANP